MANFTDFDPLMAEDSVQVVYIDQPTPKKFDAIILPGSKTTIADCLWLHTTGLADWIKTQAAAGSTILGICGGLQILGQKITDPDRLEGDIPEVTGLGLMPVETVMLDHKVLRQRQVESEYFLLDKTVVGYEIHQGQSNWLSSAATSQPLFGDTELGWVWQEQIWATYLHGLFDSGAWRRSWLNRLRQIKGLPPLPINVPDYTSQRNDALDAVADLVGEHLDLKPLF